MFVQPFRGEKVILQGRGCWKKKQYCIHSTFFGQYPSQNIFLVFLWQCAAQCVHYQVWCTHWALHCPVGDDHSLRSCLTTGFSLAAGRGHRGHEDKWDEAHLHRDDLPMSIQTRFIILTSICWKNQPKEFWPNLSYFILRSLGREFNPIGRKRYLQWMAFQKRNIFQYLQYSNIANNIDLVSMTISNVY